MVRSEVEQFTVEPVDSAVGSAAESPRAFRDGVEYRLHISRRVGDHLQDRARRRLPIQRLRHQGMSLREGTVFLLQLREQPHVLDGDDGLVGEGLE
jgi:hypothetical protein